MYSSVQFSFYLVSFDIFITSDSLEMGENYNTFFGEIGSTLPNKIVAHPNYAYTQTTTL